MAEQKPKRRRGPTGVSRMLLRLDPDKVLEEIALLSHSDITHYRMSEAGDLELAPGADPRALRAVSSFKRRVSFGPEGGLTVDTTITLWNKVVVLRLAGEHLQLFHGAEASRSAETEAAEERRKHALERMREMIQGIRARHESAKAIGELPS